MRTTRTKSILLLSYFIIISSAFGDDCDPMFVASQISALESKSEYKNCKLEDMKQIYSSSSGELIQYLDLLKDIYRQSIASNGDDNLITSIMDKYSSELNMANKKILEGNSIDISAAIGKQQLRQWTRDVHNYSRDPKRRIDTIHQGSLPSSDQLMLCKAEFQWKISRKWHQRIIHCIDEATNANGNTDAASDDSTTKTGVISE